MKSGERKARGQTEREGTKGMITARTGGSKTQQLTRKKVVKQLLTNNTKIERANRRWCVKQHIGSGGFGDVYRVFDEKNPAKTEYAMKTEYHGAKERRLSIEKSILKEIDSYSTAHQKTRHFCELIDSGQTQSYSWIIMTLIGPSLDQVRRMLNKQFTKPCCINMALQILDAVEMMHEVGFIHRDLKPANICTGVPPQDDHILYVLDFGISRRIFKNSKSREMRNPRDRVPFFGTRKFCNRACHLEMDQGRKDDIETYVYTVLDLFHNERGLPWSKDLMDHKKVIQKKKALFANPAKELDKMIPPSFANIITYLNGLKFLDAVNYRLIESELRSARKGMSTSDPSDESMDWTGRLEQLLKEPKWCKKEEAVKKSDETLRFEELERNLKERKRERANGRTVNESSQQLTKDGEGSEGPPTGFNDRALTTDGGGNTTGGMQPVKRQPSKIGKKKSLSRN